MAHQSLIWTALPNGLTDDGEALRVSVMLTPRLDPEADPARLGSFAPDWLDWPATLSRATVHLHYGGATVSVPVGQTAGADRVDDSLGTADRDVWKALFQVELLVRGGPFKDQSANQILSYDTTEMASLVASLYGTLAGATPGRLPTVTEALNQPGVDALVGAVQAIDRTFTDQETGLRDTRRQFEAYRKNGLVEQEGLARTLALTQLFHTPPSTPIAERHTRLDDPRIDATWREHEQTALPAPADLAKRLDFHQVLAAMNPYPTLLRRLGIVVDLAVSRAAFADAADAPLWASVPFEPDDLAVPRGPDTSPGTHASLSPTAFAAVPNPAPGPAVMRVSDGLLDLDPKRFALLDVDVDGAGLKVMNFARSLARHARGDERVDSVTRKEKELGAPALRTAGLMLVHRERAAMLAERFGTTAAKNALAQEVADAKPGAAPPELWAEDLLRGFRFDAWDATAGRWRSLCRREATYVLGGGAVKVEPAAGEEEGTVRLAATKSPDPASNPGLLWLHEAVVSWTGWSLAAPPPGRAILPDDSVGSEAQTEAELPPGLDFRSRFRAARRSLPRLRFGRRYWLRARAVDLAGNSLPPQENDFGPEQPAEHARPFLRYEPVAAPVIALVKRDDGTTERPAEGESMQRIAIRSFNDAPGDNAVPSTQTARRFAVPQQVSAREAELHGALDVVGRVDPATFDMLANQRDRDAHDPAAALIEEVIPTQGPLDATPADTPFAVYHDGRELTYLPDPLAREVAVRIFGHPDVDEAAIITVPLYPGADWPQAAPFKVEVLEAPGDVPAYDEGSRTLRVPLAKAERVTVRLSMRLSEHALDEIMGVWRWVAGPNPDLRALALDGQQWALTRGGR